TSMLSLKFSAPAVASLYTVNVSAASDGLDDDGAGTTAQFQVYNLLVDDDKVECPTASFTTISAALAKATAGDTVQICKGTYTENNLAITQNNLTLQGYSGNRDDVMINTASSAGLTIKASDATIKNLSIASTGTSNYGITDNWQGSGSHTFQNLSVSAQTDSIYLGQNSLNNTFSNLAISSSSGKGITLAYNASGNHIFSNISIQSYDNGIDIAHSGTLNMSDINITSTNGIGINASSGITLLQNFNITAKTYGVNAVFGQDSTIRQGFIATTNNNGINLSWGSAHILSIKDTVISAGGTGIYIPVASSATIDHVCITAATYGIKTDWNALNVTIKNSKFTNNTNNAVNIDSDPSHNAIVTNNCFRTSPFAYRNNTAHTFNGNSWNGIAPSGYDNSPLSSCPINACYSPIQTAAEYRMDECAWNGTNGEVIDSSNSYYNATPKSDNGTIIPQVSAQIINNGALFTRTNKQYIQLPTLSQNQPNFNDGFTVTTWAKFSSAGSWERIFDFGNGTNLNNIFLGRQGTTNNLVLGIHDPGADNYLVASNAISDTNWHFWGATCNGSGGCKLYKDGVMIAQSTTMKIPANVARTKNYIGKSNWSADAYLEGGVDEFKVFDATLSDSEILNIYTNENSKNNYDGTARTLPCCCLPTGGNLIANPSFEIQCNSNIVQTWDGVAGGTVHLRDGLCGWNVAYYLETWENTTAPAASDGTIFTEIDGNGGQVDKIWQTLDTVAGTNYIISFDYRKRDTSHSDVIIAKWNDVAVTQVEGNTAGWQTAQIQVTGTAGIDKISFEEPSSSDDGYGSWIDNIRVEQGTLVTECTSFKYEPYHSYDTTLTPSYRLQTRIANQPFDVNVTVACADSGTIPSRKIKNIYAIDALAASCNATTPKLFTLLSNGAYDINETNRVITIPNLNIAKAYSNIKLMIETNSSELYCSSDSFAIRPPSFGITSPTGSTKAADFTLQISALNSGTGYNGTANVTTELQVPNPNCPVSSGFLKSSISPTEPFSLLFQNDNNSSTAKATDVGIIYLNTKDTTWTTIDRSNDCIVDSNTTTMNAQGLLGCNIENNLSLNITPDHFDVNATLSNFGGGFTYLSNDLNMSAQLGLIITAKNDENITTQNYTEGCYSKDTTVTLLHSVIPDPLSKILYSEALSGVNSNVLKGDPWILTFNNGLFNNGTVTPNIELNFDRNETKPLNPFYFTVT
ncbi:MAG: right-handed parallel beta-helix repeat-containing protein, partial [Sulfuricurvum sp.]|nr:right-handed parallel beta-helix repeat-containing protein [Sulfuricurvum sp.]